MRVIVHSEVDHQNITKQKEQLLIRMIVKSMKKAILNTKKLVFEKITLFLIDLFEAKYNLKVLQQKGIIKRIGPANGGYWKVLSDEAIN